MFEKGELTLGGQFTAYKRGQLERNIHTKIIWELFFFLSFLFCFSRIGFAKIHDFVSRSIHLLR